MFNFFVCLALSIFAGGWVNVENGLIVQSFIQYFSGLPIFNMFNNSTDVYYSSTGDYVTILNGVNYRIPALANFIAVILSAICCISVFFIIVKAVKKLFTCFLDR